MYVSCRTKSEGKKMKEQRNRLKYNNIYSLVLDLFPILIHVLPLLVFTLTIC